MLQLLRSRLEAACARAACAVSLSVRIVVRRPRMLPAARCTESSDALDDAREPSAWPGTAHGGDGCQRLAHGPLCSSDVAAGASSGGARFVDRLWSAIEDGLVTGVRFL